MTEAVTPLAPGATTARAAHGLAARWQNCSIGSLSFKSTLAARGHAAAIVLSDEQVEQLGEGARRFPVKATVNGHSWRTSVARMHGEFLVGLNREVREAARAGTGDTVQCTLELDTEPRAVELPEALRAALASDPAAQDIFDKLAFTHRKEYARWIAEAKRAETRERRVTQALEMIKLGEMRS